MTYNESVNISTKGKYKPWPYREVIDPLSRALEKF